MFNSDGCVYGGVVGVLYMWVDGFVGLLYSGYELNYGLVVESDVWLWMC